MNTQFVIRFFTASAPAFLLLLCIFGKTVSAEVRSGFCVCPEPVNQQDSAGFMDFSRLDPAAMLPLSLDTAAVPDTPDVYFKGSRIIAPYGICNYPSLDIRIQTQVLNGKVIPLDRTGLFYIDSMMKRFKLQDMQQLSSTGFQTSLSAPDTTFIIRTAEGKYAALVKVGRFVGRINQTYYYWSYQPDGSGMLYKDKLFTPRPSLSITLDVFSGRPNPRFELLDPPSIEKIERALFLAVNYLLDPTLRSTACFTAPSILGYRGLSVKSMFQAPDQSYGYAPQIDMGGGYITYYPRSIFSSIEQPQCFYDRQLSLEKLILGVCCQNRLEIRTSTDSLLFCGLVPDSLIRASDNREWQSLGNPVQNSATPDYAEPGNVLDVAVQFPARSASSSGLEHNVYVAAGALGLYASDFKWNSTAAVGSIRQWVKMGGGLGANGIQTVLVSGDTIWLGTSSEGVFRSVNQGFSWTVVSEGLPQGATLGTFLPMVRLDSENGLLFVKANNGELYQLSAGKWENVKSLYAAFLNGFSPGMMPAGVPGTVLCHVLASYSIVPAGTGMYRLGSADSATISGWNIQSIIKTKSALFALTRYGAPWLSNPSSVSGHVLMSIDSARTWLEASGPLNLMPILSGESDPEGGLFIGIGRRTASSIAPDWMDGVYYSADNGASFVSLPNGRTDFNVAGLRRYGTDLLAYTFSNEVVVRDLTVPTVHTLSQFASHKVRDAGPVSVLRSCRSLTYRITEPGTYHLELFDLGGKRAALVCEQYRLPGEYRLPLRRNPANGMYLLRCARSGAQPGKWTIPVVLAGEK